MPPTAAVGEAAPSNGVPAPGPSVVANNIVGSAPLGAVAVGAAPADDPITQYEEADKFQVLHRARSTTIPHAYICTCGD